MTFISLSIKEKLNEIKIELRYNTIYGISASIRL